MGPWVTTFEQKFRHSPLLEPVHMEVRYLEPPRYLTLPETTLSRVHMKIEWVITPGAIRTRHNNTRENCILNVQDGVRQELCFITFSIFSLFVAVLYKLNEFLLVYCACSHVASASSAMLAFMCEYWSCALQSKLFRPPEISRCRGVHVDNSCPG